MLRKIFNMFNEVLFCKSNCKNVFLDFCSKTHGMFKTMPCYALAHDSRSRLYHLYQIENCGTSIHCDSAGCVTSH